MSSTPYIWFKKFFSRVHHKQMRLVTVSKLVWFVCFGCFLDRIGEFITIIIYIII